MSEVATLAGVSLATAERALNGRARVKPATRDRVLAAANELRYMPSSAASALSRQDREVRIGICVPRELAAYFDQIRRGLATEAERPRLHGVKLVYATPSHMEEDVSPYIDDLVAKEVQALLVCPGKDTSTSAKIKAAEASGIRVVCCSNDLATSGRTSAVVVDPELAGRMAAELFLKFSPVKRRVLVVTGSLDVANHARKASAFQTAINASGAFTGEVLLLQGHDDPVLTYQLLEETLDREPGISCIFVSTANCLPACRLIAARQLQRSITLVTSDVFSTMRTFLEDGTILASLYQRPYRLGLHGLQVTLQTLRDPQNCSCLYSYAPEIIMAPNLAFLPEFSDHTLSMLESVKPVSAALSLTHEATQSARRQSL